MTDLEHVERQEIEPRVHDPALMEQENPGSMGWMDLSSTKSAWQAAEIAIQSKMLPACYKTPASVLIAVQTGSEAGLTPMASVRAIYVVNTALSWMTEAARGLVQRGSWNPWTRTATRVLMPGTDLEQGVWHADHERTGKRADCEPECHGWIATHPRVLEGARIKYEFSVGDAMIAGLWGKTGPWQEYFQRMLLHRAVGFHFKDHYAGVMMGLPTAEELQDWPQAAIRRQGGPQSPVALSESVPEDPLQMGDGLESEPAVSEGLGETGEVLQSERAEAAGETLVLEGDTEPEDGR